MVYNLNNNASEENMSFISFLVILFIDIIIISLATETRLYSHIITSIRTIMPKIIMAFIILFPLFAMDLLITACNALYLIPVEPHSVQAVNEYSNGFKEFGLNIIIFSPLVLLVFCFIIQSDLEIKDEINIKKPESDLKRINISIIFNYLALTILMIFIFIDIFHTKNNFPIKLMQYIKRQEFKEIINYPENTIRVAVIIILGIVFYMGIFTLPKYYIGRIMSYDNNLPKRRKYNILIFIPFLNIYIVYNLMQMRENAKE